MGMSPRPVPDLDLRRDQAIRAARDLAKADGWPAVTVRRLADLLGLATLQASGRLRPSQAQARLGPAHRMLTQQETP
jgi:hypothetical protein